MCRLIWGFTGRTYFIVGNLMSRLNYVKVQKSYSKSLIHSKRTLVKRVKRKINFLLSQPKHMLWVLKRTVSVRRFFWAAKKYVKTDGYFVWFDSLRPINNLSVIKGRVFLGWTSTKLGLMCLAQGHKAVTLVRLKPAAPRSRVKHSTTEPLHPKNRWVRKYLQFYAQKMSKPM